MCWVNPFTGIQPGYVERTGHCPHQPVRVFAKAFVSHDTLETCTYDNQKSGKYCIKSTKVTYNLVNRSTPVVTRREITWNVRLTLAPRDVSLIPALLGST